MSRTAKFNAPAETLFAQINDYHKWEGWSPWAELDPHCNYAFEGPTSGKGAKFKWIGNSDVGEGEMEILESKPNESIKMRLEFFKPMAGVCDTDFTFKSEGKETVVTWTMSGKNDFMSKAFCLFMNMDKMIGGDFERGLGNMKKIVEGEKK